MEIKLIKLEKNKILKKSFDFLFLQIISYQN